MGVFSAPHKSFKLDRRSHFASKLKSLILDRLLRFCPDYADDVLAEYITVLVCNGKNQNQARDDLEAFLGERSEEFVSWLWHILLKYEPSISAGTLSDQKEETSFNSCDTYRETDYRNGESQGLQSQGNSESDNLMGKGGEEFFYAPAKACKPHDMLTSEDDYSQPPAETVYRTIKSSGPQSKFTNVKSSTMVDLSSGEHQSASLHNSEEPSSLPRTHPGFCPQRGPISSTHSSHGMKLSERPRMHCEAAALQRSTSLPLVASSHDNKLVASSHDNKPRRSVWDRLGRPQEDVSSRGHNVNSDAIDKTHITKEWIGHHPSVIQKRERQIVRLSPPFPLRTDGHGNRICQIVKDAGANKVNDSKRADDGVETISEVPSVSNIRRKRHFGDLTSQKEADMAVEVVPQACKRPEVPLEASQVVDSVRDVKLRLRQVEIEMAKLRSKQIEMKKDEKAKLLMNHGAVKATEEDSDSRTIHVTNVHYKATKEALSMYFGKCGAVVNVVILTDNKPFALQRSAYITFASKESADKALGFSGTTFYSRTIMVSRKGEKAVASSAKFAGVRSQVHASQPKCSVTPDQFSFPGSHLQWRRESLTSTHSETPASKIKQMTAAAGSASQQKLSATSVSEQHRDSNQCPSDLPGKINEAET